MGLTKDDIINAIKEMKVTDLNDLVKGIEEEFGVTAAAMAVAGPAAGGAEEAAEVNVELTSAGENKVSVIKAVREITGLGLMDAKKIVDDAPAMLKESVDKAAAEELKATLTEAGATVTFK